MFAVQTGSGKTYTMHGGGNDRGGVTYRTMQRIFETMDAKQATAERAHSTGTGTGTGTGHGTGTGTGTGHGQGVDGAGAKWTYAVSVAMMEIYNDEVVDLLHAYDSSSGCSNSSNSTGAGTGGASSGNGGKDGAAGAAGAAGGLDIRQAPDGGISVPGLRQVRVAPRPFPSFSPISLSLA